MTSILTNERYQPHLSYAIVFVMLYVLAWVAGFRWAVLWALACLLAFEIESR